MKYSSSAIFYCIHSLSCVFYLISIIQISLSFYVTLFSSQRPDETKASADTGKVNGAEPTKKAAEPSPKQPSVAPPKKQRAAAEEVEVKKEVKSVQEPATQKKSEAPPVEVKKSAESAAAVATPAIEAKEAAEAQGEEASESSKADLKQKIAKKLNPKAKVFKPKAATAPAGSIPPVHAGVSFTKR